LFSDFVHSEASLFLDMFYCRIWNRYDLSLAMDDDVVNLGRLR
jgi:hypothetical protein